MTVIWGLDLKDMQWSKFKGSYMFNRTYHLRRSKMIVYQMAMILCVCSESVGTAAVDDYVLQQRFVEGQNHLSTIYNNDFVGVASYNIFVGIAIATIFGAGFFFDLFWPERQESKAVRLAWKISAVVVTTMALASAIAMTVIVATKSATFSGVDAKTAEDLLKQSSRSPNLIYRHNPYCVAAVALLWPGWAASVASTIILFASHRHDDRYGPKSGFGRRQEEEASKEQTEV